MKQKDTSFSPVTMTILLVASTIFVAALVGASGAMDSVYEHEYQIEYIGEPSAQELVTRGGALSSETVQVVSESELSVTEQRVFNDAKRGETVVHDANVDGFQFEGKVIVGPVSGYSDYSVVFIEEDSGTVSEYQIRTVFDNHVIQWLLMDSGMGSILVLSLLGFLLLAIDPSRKQ